MINPGDKIKELEDELKMLIHGISHDLNEPLRMVNGFLSLLESKYSQQLDDKAREYIYYAKDGATRLSVMINSLLEYSRISNNAIKNVTQIEIKPFLNDLMINKIKPKYPEVTVKLTSTNNKVITNKPNLKLLFESLLDNSLRFSDKDDLEIDVKVEEDKNYYSISQSDNGKGIPLKIENKAFLPFVKFGKNAGMGLGLAKCKKIVDQCNGEIRFDKSKEKGTLIKFKLSK